MGARARDSRPTAIRWLLLLCVLVNVHGGGASGLYIQVRHSGQTITNNPVSLFQGDSPELACFCPGMNQSTSVELLHNQIPIRTAQCPGLYHTINSVTVSHEGEYLCRGSYQSTTFESETRTIEVLDPDDINAPREQYALHGSSYMLQCSTSVEENSVITWCAVNGDEVSEHIHNVSLSDEGEYVCKVFFDEAGSQMNKPVNLYVLVPPVITQPLPPLLTITGNPTKTFSVPFRSRFKENTTVVWYRDDEPINTGVETTFEPGDLDPRGTTQLELGQLSRSSGGEYRVEVTNSFPSIPPDQRVASSTVRLSVVVPPASPSELTSYNSSQFKVRLEWRLTPRHPDEAAETLTVSLTNRDSMERREYTLPGNRTSALVDVVPGMHYTVQVTARNVDRVVVTEPHEFQANSSAPNVTSVHAKRLNMTSFNITAHLQYTGGGDITQFLVSFRKRKGMEWNLPVQVAVYRGVESELTWHGIVTNDKLGEPSDIQVVVVNEAGHLSTPRTIQEALTSLSAPSIPHLLSSSHDSLTFSTTLPERGTPPVLHLIVNFTAPRHFQWSCIGAHALGEELPCTVPRLSPATAYTLAVYGVGHAGTGNASEEVTFTTAAVDNSLPMWVIAVVAVVVAITVLIVALALILVIVHCCRLHQKKRLYNFNTKKATEQTAPKPLESSHSILNRQKKPSLSGLSDAPPTPPSFSLPSSSTTPHSNSTPSTTVTFNRYETTSNSSCSNLDSEVSEAQSPTYTYRVSPPPREMYHSYSPRSHTTGVHHATGVHGTRESLASIPPAPKHCATNV